MSTFTSFLQQLASLSSIVLDETQAEEFLTNADKILDEYKRVVSENVAVAPTPEDISRYYIYYAAYTKFNAINASVEWDTFDTFPIPFEEYNEKAISGGWTFLRNSIGSPIKEWNVIIPEPSYDTSEYDGEGEGIYYEDEMY